MNPFVRYLWFLCAALALIVLLATIPVYYNHIAQAIRSDSYDLGQLNLPFQVLLDLGDLVSTFMSFALAVLLFWRKPNDRMALFASFFFLITAVVWGYPLDYFLTAYFGAPSTYALWSNLSTPLGILLISIFPDGRFVPRWTRWLFLVSILTRLAILAGAEWNTISGVVDFPLFILVMYAQVDRYRRVSSYAERQQTKWWVLGLIVTMALALIGSLIYKKLGPPLFNVTPIFLTIAILRSHLWDIDIIIRKTLVYSMVTAILAIAYLSSIILLQQIFHTFIGTGGDLAIIISTLAIAALFNPLRHRVQEVIDHRFYRRKYDAQKVLERFAITARDEVELETLTGELVSVVNETMQPASMSLWLKRINGEK